LQVLTLAELQTLELCLPDTAGHAAAYVISAI